MISTQDNELVAAVESEHVPEPKWPEKIIVYRQNDCWTAACTTSVAPLLKMLDEYGLPYRILRISPPVERRVEIDFEGIKRDYEAEYGVFVNDSPTSNFHGCKEIIQRHARIVEEPKP